MIWVPPYAVLEAANILVPNDRTVIVDGTIKLTAGSPDGSVIFRGSDNVNGNNNIRILGNGTLDGNKANQSGVNTKHGLVHFANGSNLEFAVAHCKGNYFPRSISAVSTTGAILYEYCTNVSVHDSTVEDFGREGFWIRECYRSTAFNLKGFGGEDSWSCIQIGGEYNRAYNLYSFFAGASGIGFDSRYSTLSDIISIGSRYFHGVNFGHTGSPASHSVVTNVKVDGTDRLGTANVSNGIQVGGGTDGLVLSGIDIKGAAGNGIQVSDSSRNITISNFNVWENGEHGIKLSGDSTVSVQINNGRSNGNTGVGLRMDGGLIVEATNVNLTGNTGGAFGKDGTSIENFNTVRMSQDAFTGSVSIAGLGADGTVAVTNGNIRTNSRVMIRPTNAQGEAARPWVSSVTDGSMVITTVNSGAGGAFCRWSIL